jgi:hypothetical protein
MELMFESTARTIPLLALIAGLIAVLLVAGPGPGYRFGLVPLPLVFQLLKYGAYFGMAAVTVGTLALVVRLMSGQGALTLALAGIIFGVAAVSFVMNFRSQAQAVPPIHDISTDTENAPQFVAAVPLREAAGATNPPEYVGAEPMPGNPDQTIAEAQHAAYPDLQSIFIDADPGVVSTAILATIDEMGWDLIEASTTEGRFEATATTFWYGFNDDVVIRMDPQRDGAVRVDVRSKSRVGVSDVGANAARIRDFVAALQARVGG